MRHPGKVRGLEFDNVDLKLISRTDFPKGVYDKRPCVGEGFVNDDIYGFYIDNASDIDIDRCTLTWGAPSLAKQGGFSTQLNARRVKIKNEEIRIESNK